MFFVSMLGYVRRLIGHALRVASRPIIALTVIKFVLTLMGGPRTPRTDLDTIEQRSLWAKRVTDCTATRAVHE